MITSWTWLQALYKKLHIGMCRSLNSNLNVVGILEFFCKPEIRQIFRDIYVGFGFSTFVVESFVIVRHTLIGNFWYADCSG